MSDNNNTQPPARLCYACGSANEHGLHMQFRLEGDRTICDYQPLPFQQGYPGRMHGEPCFTGSRVPIKTLFDHLRAGDPLEVFLTDFPPVTRAQAAAVIDLASRGLLDGLRLL